jgi:hypothetical protein
MRPRHGQRAQALGVATDMDVGAQAGTGMEPAASPAVPGEVIAGMRACLQRTCVRNGAGTEGVRAESAGTPWLRA